jgi:uncharacterized membrane protein
MEVLLGIFSAFGLSASAGLNAYIPLLVVGVLAHYTDWITLNSPWDLLANPWILILLGILVIIEMLADKFPAVNHVITIQTFAPGCRLSRVAASAKVITDMNPSGIAAGCWCGRCARREISNGPPRCYYSQWWSWKYTINRGRYFGDNGFHLSLSFRLSWVYWLSSPCFCCSGGYGVVLKQENWQNRITCCEPNFS